MNHYFSAGFFLCFFNILQSRQMPKGAQLVLAQLSAQKVSCAASACNFLGQLPIFFGIYKI